MSNKKGAEFLIKESNYKEIFTIEDLTEEQLMMRDAIKEFVDKEIVPVKPRLEQKDFALTEELMRKIAEMGLLGVSIPEMYGGMGMGFTSTMLACDYISGATGSIATAYGAHTGIGVLPIYLYGNEEQKQKYLPKLVSGEWFGAYCLTEPDAGSDANSGKSKAKLSDDGKYYQITGQKMWISNAGFAQLFIVFAKIDTDENITGFIVERNENNGISFGEEEHKLGIRSSSTRQVFFNDTKVPVENMLGERNKGFKIAMNALNVGRIKLAAACIDAQRRVINLATNYAIERKQFNTSIANFGAIQQKIAEMTTNCFVSEAGSYRAAMDMEQAIKANVEAGMNHSEAELKGVEEFAIEASILKVYVSEAIQKCSDEGIQIYGGMGFSEDTPMEAAWRDARISRIYEGTNEINRLLSVGMLVKRAMKGQIDILTPAMAVGEELMGIPSFEIPDYNELFAEEKEIIAKLKKVFLMVAGNAVKKYMMELEKQQQLLLNAADILIEIYMAESALLRAEKMTKENRENAEIAVACAKLNLFVAVEKIQTKAKEGIISFTENDEQRVMLSGLKRWTKYQNFPNIVALKEQIAKHTIEKVGYDL